MLAVLLFEFALGLSNCAKKCMPVPLKLDYERPYVVASPYSSFKSSRAILLVNQFVHKGFFLYSCKLEGSIRVLNRESTLHNLFIFTTAAAKLCVTAVKPLPVLHCSVFIFSGISGLLSPL